MFSNLLLNHLYSIININILSLINFSELNCLSYSESLFNYIINNSIWDILLLILFSILGNFWLFSNYLEYDNIFTNFLLKLTSFLLIVWLSTLITSIIVLILAWELIGFISFY